jgi:nitrite reductase/ring-hydroxylating ferredoxin subunit/uncharacterized membrane protein
MASSETCKEWVAGEPTSPAMHDVAERLGKIEALDTPAGKLAGVVGKIPAGRLKDALSGTWLGHALHPFLTDIPIGSWTSATFLDLVGGEESAPAAERLVGLGVAAALPTALTGMTEWADSARSDTEVRRIGVVHAGANVAALALFAASLVARRDGNHTRGKLYGLGGMAALTVGGHLGGHLSYAKGVGVDQTTFQVRSTDWRPALVDGALAEGEKRAVEIDGVPVLLVREAGALYALANRCCHRGGPLDRGTIADGSVTCPWHGSTFRLSDGSIVRGPAAYPQPVYDVRLRDGSIEVRARART